VSAAFGIISVQEVIFITFGLVSAVILFLPKHAPIP
jgi:hypothetical protein